MKTILQIIGNPEKILDIVLDYYRNRRFLKQNFSRLTFKNGSLFIFYYNSDIPNLDIILELQELFEVRRIDSRYISIFYMGETITSYTPGRISDRLKSVFVN